MLGRRMLPGGLSRLSVILLLFCQSTPVCSEFSGKVGISVPLRWGGLDSRPEFWAVRHAAAAVLAAHHINNRVSSLVPNATELLPAGFKLVFDIQDTLAQPSVAVKHAVEWNEQGVHAIIGSYRSAVTGPLALAASIEATPVIVWAAAASTLSDRETYPRLSRLATSDAVLVEHSVEWIRTMGWTRIAILYVNDAWGRSFSADAESSADKFGVEVIVAAKFTFGDVSDIERAMTQIAESGARVILAITFDSDLASLAAAADSNGLVETGYVWLLPTVSSVADVVRSSLDPDRTRARLSGWLSSSLEGQNQERFQSVLESEPIEHLNQSVLHGVLSPEVITDSPCDRYCGILYDSVWTAAIAIGQVGVAEDGSVDKEALLGAIREVSFQGASGSVEFEPDTGERDTSNLPLIIRNLQPSTSADGTQTLSLVSTWRWQSGELYEESSGAPLWPGGERGWVLPHEVLACGPGAVFSSSTFQCEPCPQGTAKEGNTCVTYDATLGIVVPFRWGGPDSPMEPWAIRNAAAAILAVRHINNRVSSLVPNATELLPAGFTLVFDFRDTYALPSVAVNHVVDWNEQGRHAIIGSYRSAVTGPLALAASIEATPVVSWGATASSLSDRETYPTLARSCVSDAVLAANTIKTLRKMGWLRIAIIYVNDAWGRGFSRDAVLAANSEAGMAVVVNIDFDLGDPADIEHAVSQVADSGVRIILCVAFGLDIPRIAAVAEAYGLLQSGYAWLAPEEQLTAETALLSPDPEATTRQLAGWLTASVDTLFGAQGAKFQGVFGSEPIEHLNTSVLNGVNVRQAIESANCDQFCAFMYDAVWAAAIAIGRVGVAEDGSVDKEALLGAIREVSFQGASGSVEFEPDTGERDASNLPLIIRNLQPSTSADGTQTLSLVSTWRLQSGELYEESSGAPLWPGGERGWVLPHEVLACGPGAVFSSSTFQCEPCPQGTAKEGNACIKYDASVGVLIPMRWGGPNSPMEPWAMRHAAAAVLAAHHINNRVSSLVPNATELLPAGFKLVFDIRDTYALPSVAVNHVVDWNEQERHAIIGSYRSAVTGPLALAASIEATPVIVWAAAASTLSDRETYPTLSRTTVSDRVLAGYTINFIRMMGWTRIAVMYVNDAWGRGYFREATATASIVGAEVVVAPSFSLGVQSEIEQAVLQIASSGARIVLCVAFQSDLAVIAAAAAKQGLLRTGYAWISCLGVQFKAVAASSPDPDATLEHLSGWMTVTVDPMDGHRRSRFQSVLESEPIEHLNQSVLHGVLSLDVVTDSPCDQFCGILYDSVWAAAIAIGQVGVAEDGSVDKKALLGAIREVSFQGASGRVEFEPDTGERDTSSLPLTMYNLRPVETNGTLTLSEVVTWMWRPGVGSRVEEISSAAPLWPGGERGWVLPHEVLACGPGAVFSSSTFQCEPCPQGTAKEGNTCVTYDASVGVLVPMRWGGPDSPMEPWAMRHAAAAVLAAHHINNRVSSLVPNATELLPAGFKLVFDIRDTYALPSVAVNHVVDWNEQERHAIIGSYRSAVTGPLALAASIEATPVVSWGASASSLIDEHAYPTLSSAVFQDSVLADRMTRSMRALGWTRFAILSVNDAWGRGIANDFTNAATQVGLEVEVVASFEDGVVEEIAQAITIIGAAESRIVLCAVFDADVPVVADIADKSDMLRGYAWILPFDRSALDAMADSEDSQRQLTGWITGALDPMYGERKSRFQSVLESEPIQHLDQSVLDGVLSPDVITDSPCDRYCGILYDSVWAAAIAIGRVGVAEDGSVDKEALLGAIREVSFQGASGSVEFEPDTGRRDASLQPLVLKNVRPRSRRAGQGLESVVTWQWWPHSDGSGSLTTLGSEAPFWPGGTRDWSVPHDGVSCLSGELYSGASGRCEPCPAGSFLSERTCKPCPLGTFSDLPGAVQCARCQVGVANATGLTACIPCPRNTVRGAASPGVSLSECLCVIGTYSRSGPGRECVPCGTGARCDGGTNAPYPLHGFWGDRTCQQLGGSRPCSDWEKFIPCNPSDNCVGGANFSCGFGRTGMLCLETTEGFSNVGGVFFWRCGDNGKIITVAGMVAVVLVWFVINGVASGQYMALNIALLFVQTTAIIGSYGLKWHPNLDSVNLAMGVANFDVDFVAASCLVPWGPVQSFYMQLALPFLFGVAYVIGHLLLALWQTWRHSDSAENNWVRMLQQTRKHFVSFVLINYLTLAIKCFQPFSCLPFPDGTMRVRHAPSVECWKGGHLTMVMLSAVYIVGVLISLPVWLWRTMRRHMKQGTLHAVDTERQWGFVHDAYEADWKWWECILILRRGLIAFIAVVVPEPMLQGAATLIVLSSMLAGQVFTAPFIRADIDLLDFLSISGSMLYTLAGMLFYPSVTELAQGHLCSEDSEADVCAGDQDVKSAVSVVALTTIVMMVLVAFALTVRSVRERRMSALAARKIKGFQGASLHRAHSTAMVAQSTNRVSLDQVLAGHQLLSWARQLSEQSQSFRARASAAHFLEVEQGLADLSVDLTPCASHPLADLMRVVCELPGFLDFLASADEASVQALRSFVDDFASFLDRAEQQNVHFMCQESVGFEHRPLLSYWLASADVDRRQHFRQLIEAIQTAAAGDTRKVRIGLETPRDALDPSATTPGDIGGAATDLGMSVAPAGAVFVTVASTRQRDADDGGDSGSTQAMGEQQCREDTGGQANACVARTGPQL